MHVCRLAPVFNVLLFIMLCSSSISVIHFHLLLTGLIRQGARCKACKMSVHHKCRDNVPYCPGDRVSVVKVDSLFQAFV